ncbi:hypothetical protein D9619_002155 [Psilocybe cf. subviscida]|uniref:Uncharacterized protein n=1 Tax=Psilocybe cf. subviscida TaxID=2480587 RepID=A0A8H5BEL3_9AGAR|nr:hypothetical protein D9619_002155 [Psilocybe cf. subviscida]
MDSLYDTLKNALQQAADCRKLFEDAKEESQRLAAKYQDIVAERQTLREANRTMNSTIFQLRAKVEDLETQLELQLDNMTRPCACRTQGSSITSDKRDGAPVMLDSKPPAPIPISALDGKDVVENVAQGRQPRDFTEQETRPKIMVRQDDSSNKVRVGSNTSISRPPSISSNGKSPTFDSRIWGFNHRSRFPDAPSHHSLTSYDVQGRTQHDIKETAKQQAGIPFVLIAEDALAIAHRVPTFLDDMQLLVPDNLVSIAARTLCSNASYRIAESASERWRGLVVSKSRCPHAGPSAWNTTTTVPLIHTSPPEVETQEVQNPTHILIHPQSFFHFNVEDATRTCLNPNPPSTDLASIRFPTWPAFFDMVVDTRCEPPEKHQEIHPHLWRCQDHLVSDSLAEGVDGALFENERCDADHHTPDFRRLLPQCWRALHLVKDENKLPLARYLLGSGGFVGYEAPSLERYLVKRGVAYVSHPWGPQEQEARLRPLAPLVQAGIPFVVTAQDALAIVHRVSVPLPCWEMQLLVPDSLVSIVARTLCANTPYCIAESASREWRGFVMSKSRRLYPGPSAWNATTTVPLVHISPEEAESQELQSPVHILVHPQSFFHFNVEDATRTCLNPNPPSADLVSIRFPTWPAFFDMVVDTRYEPPRKHSRIDSYLWSCHDYLVNESLADKVDGALFENEPYHGDHHTFDFKRLLPQCWKALDLVKDENKLSLARYLLGPGGEAGYQAPSLERYLVKQSIATRRGLQPPAPLYPAGITSDQVPVLLRKLQANYVAQKPTFDMLYRRWPRIFRHLPKF